MWAAVLFYLCSLAAMGMAVMVSGVTHWASPTGGTKDVRAHPG